MSFNRLLMVLLFHGVTGVLFRCEYSFAVSATFPSIMSHILRSVGCLDLRSNYYYYNYFLNFCFYFDSDSLTVWLPGN